MTATKIQPGDDTHLTLLMATHSLNFVTGADRAALLAYGRDVFAAARDSKCLAQIEEPAQPVCWIRFCSDGSTEGPIMHSQICEARKTSGAWTPLYAGAAPAAASGPSAGVEVMCERLKAIAASDSKTAMRNALMNAARYIAGSAQAAPALEAPAAPAIGPKLARIMGYREHYRTWGRQLSDATELVESHPSHWRIVAEAMDELADALAAAPQAPRLGEDALHLLRRLLSNQHTLTGPEFRAELEKIVAEESARHAAAPQAPAAPSGLPSGWVPCILTHDGQYPEEVAYGPQIMMDRLKKWLGRYFELLAQKVLDEPVHAEMLAALRAVAMDVVYVGTGENTISDAARAKVEAVLEKIGAPWPSPEAAPAAPAVDAPAPASERMTWEGLPFSDALTAAPQARRERAVDALDAARLDWLEEQAKQSPTGISFDYVLHAEDGQVLEKGWRFMRRHFLGERKSNLRAAIDAAQAAAKGADEQ